jgi:hypothetical protein
LIPPTSPAWEEVRAKFYETLANMSSVLAALNAGLTHPAPGVAPAVFRTALGGVYQDLGLYASMVRSVPTHWNWAYGMVAVLGLGAVYRFMYVPAFIGWPRIP